MKMFYTQSEQKMYLDLPFSQGCDTKILQRMCSTKVVIACAIQFHGDNGKFSGKEKIASKLIWIRIKFQ